MMRDMTSKDLEGSSGIDWKTIDEIIQRAVKAARTEELRDMAEALKVIAEHIKNIYLILEKHAQILREHSEILQKHSEILKEHTRILEQHTRLLEEHSKALIRIEATLGSLTGRFGIDMERMVLSVYDDMLKRFGISPARVEKISYKDIDGRYYRKGSRLEIDIYIHNNVVYFIEVKSLLELDDVEWFNQRCEIFEKILGRKPDRKIIVAINTVKEAVERARELGMEIIYGRILEIE